MSRQELKKKLVAVSDLTRAVSFLKFTSAWAQRSDGVSLLREGQKHLLVSDYNAGREKGEILA